MCEKEPLSASLIFYSGKNYAGSSHQITHGTTGVLASTASNWSYQSVAMSAMTSFMFSDVNTANANINYSGHVEDMLTANTADLTKVYPSSDQFPLNYIGLDPTKVVLVWLDIDADQLAPNAVAATALVGDTASTITTLSLPGRSGVLGLVAKTSGSAVVANCAYGDYNSAGGTVTWSGNSGNLTLEYTGSTITLVSSEGFPDGWTFSDPVLQGDGSWAVTLSSGAVTTAEISSLTSDKSALVNDGADVVTLTAVVTDSSTGELLSGVTVTWDCSLGKLSETSSLTDKNGQAITQLSDSNDTGQSTVSASLANGSSKVTTVTITSATQSSPLIMGARSSNRAYGEYITSRLIALDAVSLEPVSVTWSYENTGISKTGSELIDTLPGTKLNITSSTYNPVTLNVANIAGSGGWYDEDDSPGSHAAFSARKDAGDIVVWGDEDRGGIPPDAQENRDALSLCANASAFTAIRSDGSLFAWGSEDRGSIVPDDITARTDIEDLRGSRGTFLLRGNSAPYIQTWGRGVTVDTESVDLNVPGNIAAMSDIKILQMTEDAACVINKSGKAFTWGDASCGGSTTTAISSLTGITACNASRRAFAVIYGTGQISAWGDTAYGGDARQVSGYSDIVRLCATEAAFLGLRSNGSIVAWGDTSQGASIPTDYSQYQDIVDIKSTYSAFAALRENGTVICWGESTHGGSSSSVSALTDVVSITGTSWSFAALHLDGTVSAWGDPSYGGDTSSVSAELNNVVAIYPNSRAFFALKKDGTFVVWGDAESGGEQSQVPASLSGNIHY